MKPLSCHCWRRDAHGAGGGWVRIGRRGWGLHVCYRARLGDYRAFSERMGFVRTRRIGPLTIRVLRPWGTGR